MDDFLVSIKSLEINAKSGEVIPLGIPKEEMRSRILAMQTQMQEAQNSGKIEKCDLNEVFPLRHIFAPQAYAREMTLPEGHWIIGKIHKHAHLNFITKGRVVVVTEDGLMFINAPYTFVSSVGTKRLVMILEETIWTTVHITEKTNLAEIEEEVIAKDYSQIQNETVKELL